MKFRWPIIVLVVLVLGTAAIPVTKMELGIPSGASANLDTPARQSYDVISKGFGEGFNGPLLLVAQPNNPSGKISMETLGKLTQELQMHDNVTLVSPMGVNETGDIAIISLIPKPGRPIQKQEIWYRICAIQPTVSHPITISPLA